MSGKLLLFKEYLIAALVDFFSFIRVAQLVQGKSTFKASFQRCLAIWFLIAVIFIPWSYVVDAYLVQLGVGQIFSGEPSISLLFSGVVLGPILEELLFRSWLKNASWLFVAFLTAVLLFWADYLPPSILTILWLALVLIALEARFGFLKSRVAKFEIGNTSLMQRNRVLLVYISTVFFAFVHVNNYDSLAQVWPMIPLALLPQFALGLFFAYVRLRVNLWAAMCWHGLSNLVAFSLMPWWPS